MAEIKLKIASVLIGSGNGGGSGVAPYYADLPDKPKINGKTLSGDKTSKDLGLASEEQSVPSGGTTGQVLTKRSNLSNDVEWAPSSGVIGANAKNLDAGSEATASIDENHILQLGIPVGKNAVNPFKGWFTTTNIPTTGQEGDYCYVDDDGTTKVWRWNPNAEPPAFEETADTPDTAHTQSFASNESVNEVAIDDSHLVNPTNTADSTQPVLARAEDVMQLKAKLEGVTFSEEKINGGVETGNAVSGNDGHIVESTNGKMYFIPIPNGLKSVRFLGWDMVSSSNVNNYGWCFGNKIDENSDIFYNNWNQLKWNKFDHNQSTNFTPKEYTDTVPSGATWLLITLKTAYIPELENPYCYGQTGNSIMDLIPDVVNSLDSDETVKSLSAAQGKVLDQTKQDKVIESYYYESVEYSSVQNAYVAGRRLAPSNSFRTSLFPVEVGKTYKITGKFGSGSGSMLYAYMNEGVFIESYISASGREGTVYTTEITIPDGRNITHVAVEWSGNSPNATCEEKKIYEIGLEEAITELMESQEETNEYIEAEREGKEINILCLGNSFTEDTMSYVPYILQESSIKGYIINIYMTYIQGASLEDYKKYVYGEEIETRANSPKLHISTNGSPWSSQSLVPFDELIEIENWDLITIQQGGSINYTSYDTNFKPYINAICQQIQRKANTGVKIGYIMSHASYVNTTDTLSFDTETTILQERFEGTNEYPGIAANARRVMEETPVSILLPYGTAVQNLRTASYLNELGIKGHLSHDHIHLTDGLPCLVAAYANALAILSYCIGEKTILSNPINPTRDFLNEKNVPSSTNGPVGLTDYNRRVAQTCAMLAIKKPFEISDIKQIGLIGDYKVSLMNTTNYDFNNPILSANEGESWSIKLTANDGYSIQSVEVTMGGSVVSGAYDATTRIVYISNVTGDIVITPTLTQI